MIRSDHRPPMGRGKLWALLGLLAALATSMAVLIVWYPSFGPSDPAGPNGPGTGSEAKNPSSVGSHPSDPHQKAHDAPPPRFVNWPDAKPTLALVVTGETLGYLRPCGCSPDQQGGIARRAKFLKYLKQEKGWQTVALELGDLVGGTDKALPEHTEAQQQLKYRFALKMLNAIGYNAVGVGRHDLQFSTFSLAEWAGNIQGPLKVIASNLTFVDDSLVEGIRPGITPIRKIKVDDDTVLVGSVLDPHKDDRFQDNLFGELIKFVQVNQATAQVLKEMEDSPLTIAAATDKPIKKPAGSTLRVLLAHVSFKQAKDLAKKHPGFDVIVSQSPYEDSRSDEAEWVGDTMVTWVGKKGKGAGVIGFWPKQSPRMRFEWVSLDKHFPQEDSIQDIYADYVQQVKEKDLLSKVSKVDHPRGATYVGSQKCGLCHKKAYAKWKDSKHAHAMDTLVNYAHPAGQAYNPECVRCHSTGFGYKSGFESHDKTPLLGGNGCENCHGPGSLHAAYSNRQDYRALMKISKNSVEQKCMKCHDAENSINFHFSTYWPKVEHPWRD